RDVAGVARVGGDELVVAGGGGRLQVDLGARGNGGVALLTLSAERAQRQRRRHPETKGAHARFVEGTGRTEPGSRRRQRLKLGRDHHRLARRRHLARGLEEVAVEPNLARYCGVQLEVTRADADTAAEASIAQPRLPLALSERTRSDGASS